MLKKISAALLVASLLAGPAMAAGLEKTAPAPITKPVKSVDAKAVNTKTVDAKALDSKLQVKPAVRNANAKMGGHHRHHHVRKHHRFHKKMAMHKTFRHHAARATVVHSKRG